MSTTSLASWPKIANKSSTFSALTAASSARTASSGVLNVRDFGCSTGVERHAEAMDKKITIEAYRFILEFMSSAFDLCRDPGSGSGIRGFDDSRIQGFMD